MELMIQWFWLVKLLFLLIGAGVLYLAVKKKSKFWFTVFAVWAVLTVIAPVKIDMGTRHHQVSVNKAISESKVLPPKVTDDSFKTSVNKNFGITSEDLK